MNFNRHFTFVIVMILMVIVMIGCDETGKVSNVESPDDRYEIVLLSQGDERIIGNSTNVLTFEIKNTSQEFFYLEGLKFNGNIQYAHFPMFELLHISAGTHRLLAYTYNTCAGILTLQDWIGHSGTSVMPGESVVLQVRIGTGKAMGGEPLHWSITQMAIRFGNAFVPELVNVTGLSKDYVMVKENTPMASLSPASPFGSSIPSVNQEVLRIDWSNNNAEDLEVFYTSFDFHWQDMMGSMWFENSVLRIYDAKDMINPLYDSSADPNFASGLLSQMHFWLQTAFVVPAYDTATLVVTLDTTFASTADDDFIQADFRGYNSRYEVTGNSIGLYYPIAGGVISY